MLEKSTVVERAIERGGAAAFGRCRRDVSVDTKTTEMDYITDADVTAQADIVETIREHYPDDAVVGEEGDAAKTIPEEGALWIIDPIDGTTNFVHDLSTWGPAVAAVEDGDPVAAAVELPRPRRHLRCARRRRKKR